MSGGSIAIVILFCAFVWGVVTVVRTLQEHHTIRQLAESGTPAEVVRALRTSPADLHLSTLRIGLVALSAGAALLLLQFLPLDRSDPAAWGILLVAVGAALLMYERLLPARLRRLAREHDDA
jgi:hypothetical protein